MKTTIILFMLVIYTMIPTISEGEVESSLLEGAPLLHNQTFLIPENAIAGDTVGDLNLMWISPDQDITFSLVDDDGGRFAINRLTLDPLLSNDPFSPNTCVSNDALDYEIRLQVATPKFDFDTQNEHTVTVRATIDGTSDFVDAEITIKLSKTEKTIFIDPGFSEETCPAGIEWGSRECPYNHWSEDITADIVEPGTAILQKRDSVYLFTGTTRYYSSFTIRFIGTEEQHIVIGAYGAGDRPAFESEGQYGNDHVCGGGFGISTGSNASLSYFDFYSLEFRYAEFGIITNYGVLQDVSFHDLHFHRVFGSGLYLGLPSSCADEDKFEVVKHKINFNGEPEDEIMLTCYRQDEAYERHVTVADCYSERSGDFLEGCSDPGTHDDYGFKFGGAIGVDVDFSVARYNENHGFSVAGATAEIRYSQSLSNALGIKASGRNIVIDHSLIKGNSSMGIRHGSGYEPWGYWTDNIRVTNSSIIGSETGISFQEDVMGGIIENNIFSDCSERAIYTHWTSGYSTVYGPLSNHIFRSNIFSGNKRAFMIGDTGEPLAQDISIYKNQFYDNTGLTLEINEANRLNIYNNLFYNNGDSNDIRVDGTTEGLVIRNNLFGQAVNVDNATEPIVDHNLKYLDSFFVDPEARDFHLLNEDVPPVNSGIDVGLVFSGRAPDIGPFEFDLGSKDFSWILFLPGILSN